MNTNLTIEILKSEAKSFCEEQSQIDHPSLLGVTDGKAVGTYIEHKFKNYLLQKYTLEIGNSANGIDLPGDEINTDIKVTSIQQPQSSCPFKNARQKIFGLGYNLLVFVYDKKDENGSCVLKFKYCTLIDKDRTADYTITKRLIEMLNDGANNEDIVALLNDRNVPGDDISYNELADDIIQLGVMQGYLTISNALQWRLQYGRVIMLNNEVDGINNYEW